MPSFTPEQAKIPFGRVNHNKYMVTEKTAYIGTSNWSGDYFLSTGCNIGSGLTPYLLFTGGVGFVCSGDLRDQLQAVFERDWGSSYTSSLTE